MRGMRLLLRVVAPCLLVSLSPCLPVSLHAHPVPSFAYDRVIRVRLTPACAEVEYQLSVDEITIFRDVARGLSDAERAKLVPGVNGHDVFAHFIGPLIADRLEGSLSGKPLTFEWDLADWEKKVRDKQQPILTDHVQFNFVFHAQWPEALAPGQKFEFQETNFDRDKGAVDLAFTTDQGATLGERAEPDEALKVTPSIERSAPEERRLREVKATIASVEPRAMPQAATTEAAPVVQSTLWQQVQQRGPVALLDSSLGFGLILLFTGLFGAFHALTPGHGKTLVASYLVGERGTVGHALLLGLVTTITHTGVVLIIAVALWLGVGVSPAQMQSVLAFAGGALIAGMGLWLLLRRLAGQADHFHVGGGHHHHHHDGDDHHHSILPAATEKVRLWNLILLGIGGGIVPCWDAIAIQLAVIAKGQLWIGPPLILSFSAGLAATLVAIGIAVVKLKGFGSSRWGKGRLIKALPLISALAITAIGLWLCFDSLRQ